MSIKLGTLGIKPPYSKIYLGTLLKYQASEDVTIETEFTSNIFPTEWVAMVTGTDYVAINEYGTWRIIASSYSNTNYVYKAFDNDEETIWRPDTISDNNTYAECIIECPKGVTIKLSEVLLGYGAQGNSDNLSALKGYNEATGEWEILYTLPQNTNSITESVEILSQNYYSKFAVVVYRNPSSYTPPVLLEFQASSGIIRKVETGTTENDYIVPTSAVLLMRLEENLVNAIDNTVASTTSATYVEGKFGYGVGKTSSSNSITFNSTVTNNLPTYAELANGTKELTVECWFKANQQTASSSSSKYILQFGSANTHSVQWYYNKYLLHGTEVTIEADSPYNNWVHIAYVIKDGIATLFVNGKKIASATFKSDTTATSVRFGTMYGGQFDEILIATEALHTEDFTPLDKPYVVK